MGLHLEKILAVIRAFQSPLSLLFLIMICWIEAVSHVGTAHPVSSALRFLASLLTMPWTAYDLFLFVKARPYGGDFLSERGAGFKFGRVFAELVLAGLWFAALVLGEGEKNTTLGNTNRAIQTPALVASAAWVTEIVLFCGSVLVVLVQTVKRRRGAAMKGEMMEG